VYRGDAIAAISRILAIMVNLPGQVYPAADLGLPIEATTMKHLLTLIFGLGALACYMMSFQTGAGVFFAAGGLSECH
jgi:hypothetical protein